MNNNIATIIFVILFVSWTILIYEDFGPDNTKLSKWIHYLIYKK